jgi:hypothetical protein
MKGGKIGVVMASAADDTDEDDRPLIQDLIQKHRQTIDQVTEEVAKDPLFEATKHDDLWILRFVLSHKQKVKAAVKAARSTLAFRHQHKLDTRDIRHFPPGSQALCNAMNSYRQHSAADAFLWTLPPDRQNVLTMIRYAALDQHSVVKHVAPEDWLPIFMYCSEWAHQWTDCISRTTGRLTKNVRLIDLSGMRVSDFNLTNSRRDGATMGLMEDCYPQLLQSIYVVNPPSWVHLVWRLIRPLMPRRVASKFDIVRPCAKATDRQKLFRVVREKHLPLRFGGTNPQWPVVFPLPADE